MGRELISLHIGQCGVQLGNAMWELLTYEHGLDTEGKPISSAQKNPLEQIECFFYEVKDRYVPRAVMIDLEPTVIDELRTGAYRQFWNPTALISGKEDAANNFARGYLTVGKVQMDLISEEILKMVERADSLSAFEIVHSYAGGTGSGLTSLVAEHLTDQFGKKFRFTTSIFPSAAYSQSTVDPYNSILFTNASMATIDCNVVLDNKALYDQCVKNLCEERPSLSLINRLVASLMSSLFLSHRFIYHGSQRADCAELLTNLIPYPRIHFPMVFYSPFCSKDQLIHEQVTIKQITTAVFTQPAATMDTLIGERPFISCAMLYRGVDSPKLIYDALQQVKGPASRMLNNFVEWCPATFKIGLNAWPPVAVPTDAIAQSPLSVCMIAGNVAIADAFGVNAERFDRMFQKRCFVHWYVGEGMEESEFEESREEVQTLEDDYNALVTVSGRDDEETEGEENNANIGRHYASRLPPSGYSRTTRFGENKNQNNRTFNMTLDRYPSALNTCNSVCPPGYAYGRSVQANRSQSRKTALRMRPISRDRREQQTVMPTTLMLHSISTSNAHNMSQSMEDGIDLPIPTQFQHDQLPRITRMPLIRASIDTRPMYTRDDPVILSSEHVSSRTTDIHNDRNCNKIHYSCAETDLLSTATLPIAVFNDIGSRCFDGSQPLSYRSTASVRSSNTTASSEYERELEDARRFVDFDDDETSSDFLQLISKTSSVARGRQFQNKRRHYSLSRASASDSIRGEQHWRNPNYHHQQGSSGRPSRSTALGVIPAYNTRCRTANGTRQGILEMAHAV